MRRWPAVLVVVLLVVGGNGRVYGAQLVVNGDFLGDLEGWTVSGVPQVVDGVLEIACLEGTEYGNVSQTLGYSAEGESWDVVIRWKMDGTSTQSMRVELNTTSGGVVVKQRLYGDGKLSESLGVGDVLEHEHEGDGWFWSWFRGVVPEGKSGNLNLYIYGGTVPSTAYCDYVFVHDVYSGPVALYLDSDLYDEFTLGYGVWIYLEGDFAECKVGVNGRTVTRDWEVRENLLRPGMSDMAVVVADRGEFDLYRNNKVEAYFKDSSGEVFAHLEAWFEYTGDDVLGEYPPSDWASWDPPSAGGPIIGEPPSPPSEWDAWSLESNWEWLKYYGDLVIWYISSPLRYVVNVCGSMIAGIRTTWDSVDVTVAEFRDVVARVYSVIPGEIRGVMVMGLCMACILGVVRR